MLSEPLNFLDEKQQEVVSRQTLQVHREAAHAKACVEKRKAFRIAFDPDECINLIDMVFTSTSLPKVDYLVQITLTAEFNHQLLKKPRIQSD